MLGPLFLIFGKKMREKKMNRGRVIFLKMKLDRMVEDDNKEDSDGDTGCVIDKNGKILDYEGVDLC